MRSQRPGALILGFFLLLLACAAPIQAQGTHEDEYDAPDPWTGFEDREVGPDSAGVARLLAALSASDPVVCHLAVRSIGNNWGWDEEEGGMLDDSARELGLRQAL